MKIYQNKIVLICMVLLFTMCKCEYYSEPIDKENSVQNMEAGNAGGNFTTSATASVKEWLFDADGNVEGWTMANASVAAAGGTLNLTTTGADPIIKSPGNLGITTPATYKFVHLDMKNNSSVTTGRIYFITNTDSIWSQAKSKAFTIKANTNYYASYIIDMSTVAGWSGTIKQIRIDPWILQQARVKP